MAGLSSFISLSIDGCYADANGEMSWAHNQDPEQAEFTRGNAQGEDEFQLNELAWREPASAQPL